MIAKKGPITHGIIIRKQYLGEVYFVFINSAMIQAKDI